MSSSLSKIKTKRQGRQVQLRTILQNEKKRLRFFLLCGGIILILLSFYWQKPLDFSATGEQTKEVTSFANEPVKIDKAFTQEKNKKEKDKSVPIRILIPSLNIDLPVKTAKVINGFWEVYQDAAGFGLGSAYPEDEGNQVIFAHAREGLFAPLLKAQTGQNIIIFTKDKWYSYTINEIKEVFPNQLEVIAPTQESILTLYTCTGFADSKRLIVIAKKNVL